MTRVVSSRSGLRAAYAELPTGTVRAVVPTMGALHSGHAQLIRAARALVGQAGHVTVTVFVNPTQFAAGEDLDRYPRSFDSDVEVCAAEGADLVFAPSVETVYLDPEPMVTIDPGPLGTLLEGAVRPGHFRGVLTVVAKLVSMTGASLLLLGEKDFQQLVLVRRMVRDLDLPVEVVGVPTVRADDGLALSSRNVYLSDAERLAAITVPRALEIGVETARAGGSARDVLSAAQSHLQGRDEFEIDYMVVTDPDLGPAPESGEGRLLVAARIGKVRLLDNVRIDLGVGG
ncbi:MAG: pantoate--beta-alanine ligase [Actinobacteria bacterium]|nr:pantoate--beta-alanine ligase [Actinomycetota bacterium]MSX37829.1 pantoate--beta-alanine ligase [Actinomycetota bacterium]